MFKDYDPTANDKKDAQNKATPSTSNQLKYKPF